MLWQEAKFWVHIWLWILADQFIACGKSRDSAHELASQIWLAVLDNLEENEHTFVLLKRLAQEGDVSCNLIFCHYHFYNPYKIRDAFRVKNGQNGLALATCSL